MARRTESTTPAEGEAAGAAPVAEVAGVAGVETAPRVLVVERQKKRGRKRYTRGSRDLQRLGYGLAKSSQRIADAVAEGVRTFAKRSDRSARKKRDGLLRDSLRNAARGLGEALSEASRAPEELARRVSTKKIWRRTPDLGKRAAFPFALWLR
jgi:hypothetical protein